MLRFITFCSLLVVFSCKKVKHSDPIFNNFEIEKIQNQNIKEIFIDSIGKKILTINIPEIIDSELVNISEVVGLTKLLKLETTDECLIGEVNKIIINDSSIFILDSRITKRVYEFNLIKGDFIRSYGRYGKGPGEYLYPIDFNIDKETNRLVILDNHKAKLLFYDLKGSFINSTRLSFRATSFLIEDESRYIYYAGASPNEFNKEIDKYQIIIGDKNGLLSYKSLVLSDQQMKFEAIGLNSIVSYNNSTMFHSRMDNIIYKIEKNEISQAIKLDLGKQSLPENYDCNFNYKEFQEKFFSKKGGYLKFVGAYFISNDKMILNLSNHSKVYTCIYSFKTNKIIVGAGTYPGKENQKGFGTLSPITTYDDFFVSYINAYNAIQYSEELSKFRDEETNSLIKNTNENDNPIIIFQQLKDF
jgi:hypothetical protein